MTGLIAGIADHSQLLGLALIYAIASAGVGSVPRALFDIRWRGRTERTCIDLLIGCAVIGTAYFGLSLCGLISPVGVLAPLFMALALPGALNLFSKKLWNEFRSLDRDGWRALPALFPVLICMVLMLLPDTDGDAYLQHLAAPARWLAAHRFVVEHTLLPFHYPMLVECTFLPALVLNRDALTHFVTFIPFMSAIVLLAMWAARLGGRTAGWWVLIIALSYGQVGRLMVISKNDLAATAFPLAGGILLLELHSSGQSGRALLGAVLVGCGLAAKYSGAVPVLMFLAAVVALAGTSGIRSPRIAAAWLLALSTFPLPWLVKTWLLTSDPAWPQWHRWLPSLFWRQESQDALDVIMLTNSAGAGWWRFPEVFSRVLMDNQPLVAVVLPMALLWTTRSDGPIRRCSLVCVIGIFLSWWLMPYGRLRYALPMLLGLSGVAGIMLSRWASRSGPGIRRGAWLAITLAAWHPVGFLASTCVDLTYAVPYLAGQIPADLYLRGRLTTYWDAAHAVKQLPNSRLGLMLCGDYRVYRMPGKVLQPTTYGQTWGWTVTQEYQSADGVRKRFRQLNCRHLIYNFVNELTPDDVAQPFHWTRAELSVWRSFVERWLDIVIPPAVLEPYGGAFCIYALRSSARIPAPPSIPYLPDLGNLADPVARAMQAGDMRTSLQEARALQRQLPGVDAVAAMVARGLIAEGSWIDAREIYVGKIAPGTIWLDNLLGAATAAARLGRWEEARNLFQRAASAYPARRQEIAEELSRIHHNLNSPIP